MVEKYYPPTYRADAFHCPHCDVYCQQKWYAGAISYKYHSGVGYQQIEGTKNHLSINICCRCNEYGLWIGETMIFPIATVAPFPTEDTPEDVKNDFLEARNVASLSPRSSAALLRLGIQKLMAHLGEDGKNINDNIGNLVKKGLPTGVQQALDAVRVIGNNAVHPGELDLKDDFDTALSLFELVNIIVSVMITQPKKVQTLYDKIPKGAQEAIKKRDKTP